MFSRYPKVMISPFKYVTIVQQLCWRGMIRIKDVSVLNSGLQNYKLKLL